MSTTPVTDLEKRTLRQRLPDFKPTTFRVSLGLGVFLLVVLLHLQLGHEGYVPQVSAGSVALSALLGLLAFWLAQSMVLLLVVFGPFVAIAALLLAVYGWLAR